MTCPSCAQPVPSDARFCQNCGHLLRGAEERRIVTVLFADLVGFTALAERRDPEQVKLLIDRCFERLVTDIGAFGGSIDKIIGDGIVALFGAPVAHEDDPERAVRAALRMQRTMATLSTELAIPVQMRIGVNTGEVLVGALRAGGDYTAMGDTVNLASRLEAAAAPGEVLVGPGTHAATEEVVRYESRGTMVVRGRAAAVAVHAAVEELSLPGRRPRQARAPLLGREPELSLLESTIEMAAARRHAHLVLVLGDGGLGKTRLAEEIAVRAEQRHDALVLEGRCLPYGETSPWWPIVDAFHQLLGLDPSSPTAEVRARLHTLVSDISQEADTPGRIVDGLAVLLGGVTDGPGRDRARERDEAQGALVAFFELCAATRPVVLLISDVHWADPHLLELAERLLLVMSTSPLIIMATTRWSVDDERWVARPGRHNSVLINLEPLDRVASARLAATLLGTDLSDDLADELFERSGGNPFFLEELTTLLSESAVNADGSDVTGPLMLELPDTLRGLVSVRLDSLTDHERLMVQDAAVIGRDGPVYALVLMTQTRGDDHAEHTFARLVAKDLFETDGAGWHFRSDLVREVAYSTLTKLARAERHAEIADWLEAHPPEGEPDLRRASRVAYHWSTAARLAAELGVVADLPSDIVDRAVGALERLAEIASASDSNLGVAKAYARMLELVDPDDDVRRLAAHLGRATARIDLHELDGARRDGEAALSIAEAIPDQVAAAQSLTLLSEVAVLAGDIARARRLVDDALARWRQVGDRSGLAEALRQSGFVSMRAGDRIDAELSFTTALDLSRELGDVAAQGWCLQNLAWLAFEQGDVDAADRYLGLSTELFESIGDGSGMSWARGLTAYVRFYQGDIAQADELATVALGEAERRAEPWATGMMVVLLAAIALWSGRTREAVELARRAHDQLDGVGDDYGRVQSASVLGRALLASGRVRESTEVLDRAVGIAGAMPGRPQWAFAVTVAAAAAVQRGDGEAALELLGRLDGQRVGALVGHIDRDVSVALAELQVGVGDPVGRLEAVTAEASSAARTNPSSALALAYAVTGRGDEVAEVAKGVLAAGQATYVDRRNAAIASGLVAARRRQRDLAIDWLEQAVAEVDQTESRLSQAVVRLARAIAYEALELPEAGELRSEADRRLDELGVPARGWERVFRVAVAADPEPLVSARR